MSEGEFKIDFGFSYKELKRVAMNSIKDQQSQMKSSNEVSIFWQAMEDMTSTGDLIDRWDYRIDSESDLKLKEGKIILPKEINVLKIRLNMVVGKYRKYAKTSGLNALPAATLEYYLKNSPYYIGESPSVRFKKSERDVDDIKTVSAVTTSMLFDYDMLSEMIDINLITESVDKYSGLTQIPQEKAVY